MLHFVVPKCNCYSSCRIFTICISIFRCNPIYSIFDYIANFFRIEIFFIIIDFQINIKIKSYIGIYIICNHISARTSDKLKLESKILPYYILYFIDNLNMQFENSMSL